VVVIEEEPKEEEMVFDQHNILKISGLLDAY
jgi:hypothetical protein